MLSNHTVALRFRMYHTINATVLDPRNHADFIEPEKSLLVDEAIRRIGFAYPKIKNENVMDAVDSYVETVLLAQWLLDSGRKAEDITAKIIEEKVREFQEIAVEILYGKLGLQGILRYSEAWRNNPLPDNMRPLLQERWHRLIEPQASPCEVNIGTKEKPRVEKISIVALCSRQDLKKEQNTVEGGLFGLLAYWRDCVRGKCHALSIEAAGKPLAMVAAKLDDRNPRKLIVDKFHKRIDLNLQEEAKQAWDWFESELAAGRIKLNPTPKKGWGETELSKHIKAHPEIIKRIGYIPTPEHVAACHLHFTHGFNVEEEFKTTGDERSLANTRRHALTIDQVRDMLWW